MTRVLGIISSTARRGAEVFAADLFDELVGRGHTCHLAALRTGLGTEIAVDATGRGRWDPAALRRMARAARAHDVVVGFGSSSLLTGAVAAALARRPFVYRSIGDPTAWADVPGRALRIALPARRATRLVVLYREAGEAWQTLHGIDSDRIEVIPNGVPSHRFAPASSGRKGDARSALGLRDDLRWLGLIGSLTEEKRPLDALSVVAANPGVGLLVVGAGSLRADLEVAAAGLGDRVRVVGALEDVSDAYSAIDALLLTSRTEGMPAVLIEAGMSGVPAIASDVGGVSRVVIDNTTGMLFAPGDQSALHAAVGRVLRDAVPMGAAARRHCITHFALEAIASDWEALLAEVGGGGSRLDRAV